MSSASQGDMRTNTESSNEELILDAGPVRRLPNEAHKGTDSHPDSFVLHHGRECGRKLEVR